MSKFTSNYDALPSSTRAELSSRAARIKAALHRGLVEVGRELMGAKDVLNHGGFTKWVETETGMSIRTAELIMRAYRVAQKYENFSDLSRSALVILGADDLPTSTLQAISDRIAAGDVPTLAEVKRITQQTDPVAKCSPSKPPISGAESVVHIVAPPRPETTQGKPAAIAVYGAAFRRYGKSLRVLPVLEKGEVRARALRSSDRGTSGRWHIHCAIELPSYFDGIALEKLIRECWAKVEWGCGRILVRDGANAGWINYMLKDRQKSEFDGFLDCIIIESLHNPIADA
jgi:hypothetical protein